MEPRYNDVPIKGLAKLHRCIGVSFSTNPRYNDKTIKIIVMAGYGSIFLLSIGSCLACVYRVMDACGKFGEHERNVRVARGAVESKSRFFLAGSVEVSVIPFRSRYDRFYRYIGVNFTFGLHDCDRYIGDIVIPRIVKPGLCSIHFTVVLARLKNVNRYIGNIVISGLHCILLSFRFQDCRNV